MQTEEKKFREKDRKGNYDLDGVSYDGSTVFVIGDKKGNKAVPEKNPQNNPNGQDPNQEVPGSDDDPVKLDRKKNLDSEGEASKI